MSVNVLPNRRDEAWKYSDLRAALAGQTPSMTGEGTVIERLAEGAGALERRLTIQDRDDIQAIDRVYSDPADKTHVVVPFMQRGVLVDRSRGTQRLAPAVTEIDIEEGASLTRIVLQRDINDLLPENALTGVILNHARVRLAAGATFRQIIVAEGSKLARIETHVDVEGDGAHVELNGVYLCGAGRHADLTSIINHHVANGETRQLIKGVARKGGRGVFQGKIVVAKDAQKTDARQYHHGMLLEEGAEIFAKPELMIHADDVQCAHGNTAGGLGERALFYMRSRGVPEAEARALLIESFLVEAIPAGLPEELYNELVDRIRTWLAGGAA